MGLVIFPGDTPVLGAPVAGRGEEAFVEVNGSGRRTLEGVVRFRRERAWASVAGKYEREADRDGHKKHCGAGKPQRPAKGESPLCPLERQRGRGGRESKEDNE